MFWKYWLIFLWPLWNCEFVKCKNWVFHLCSLCANPWTQIRQWTPSVEWKMQLLLSLSMSHCSGKSLNTAGNIPQHSFPSGEMSSQKTDCWVFNSLDRRKGGGKNFLKDKITYRLILSVPGTEKAGNGRWQNFLIPCPPSHGAGRLQILSGTPPYEKQLQFKCGKS